MAPGRCARAYTASKVHLHPEWLGIASLASGMGDASNRAGSQAGSALRSLLIMLDASDVHTENLVRVGWLAHVPFILFTHWKFSEVQGVNKGSWEFGFGELWFQDLGTSGYPSHVHLIPIRCWHVVSPLNYPDLMTQGLCWLRKRSWPGIKAPMTPSEHIWATNKSLNWVSTLHPIWGALEQDSGTVPSSDACECFLCAFVCIYTFQFGNVHR